MKNVMNLKNVKVLTKDEGKMIKGGGVIEAIDDLEPDID